MRLKPVPFEKRRFCSATRSLALRRPKCRCSRRTQPHLAGRKCANFDGFLAERLHPKASMGQLQRKSGKSRAADLELWPSFSVVANVGKAGCDCSIGCQTSTAGLGHSLRSTSRGRKAEVRCGCTAMMVERYSRPST